MRKIRETRYEATRKHARNIHYLSPLLRKLLNEAMRHCCLRACGRERKRERHFSRWARGSFCCVLRKKKKDREQVCIMHGNSDGEPANALATARKSSDSIDHFAATDIVRANVSSGTALSFISCPVLLNNYYIPDKQRLVCIAFTRTSSHCLGEVGWCVRWPIAD